MAKVGVLGSGQVAKTLAAGFKAHGYDVRIGTRTPAKLAGFAGEAGIPAGTFGEVAAWGDALVLAVLGVPRRRHSASPGRRICGASWSSIRPTRLVRAHQSMGSFTSSPARIHRSWKLYRPPFRRLISSRHSTA